jgi:hypothetical protein
MRTKRNSSKTPKKAKKADLSIDCVAMVRKIREENLREREGMTLKQEIAYINKRAKEFNKKLLAHKVASK